MPPDPTQAKQSLYYSK